MGLDCKFNGKSLDRWYVFSSEFSVGTSYSKKEVREKLTNIIIKLELDLHNPDYNYYIDWIFECAKHIKDEGNIFYNENQDEYWDNKMNIET